MSNNAYPDDRDRDSEYDEHLRHLADVRRERLAEHVTPDPKPDKRVTREEARKAGALNWWQGMEPRLWRDAVLERDQGCIVHRNPAECSEGWQAHHVVPQQQLRRGHAEALWNPLSGVGVCGKAHRQHHSGYRIIRYDELPQDIVDHLNGLGYSGYLLRHYEIRFAG